MGLINISSFPFTYQAKQLKQETLDFSSGGVLVLHVGYIRPFTPLSALRRNAAVVPQTGPLRLRFKSFTLDYSLFVPLDAVIV
jgi:hypothetical protein